MPVPKMKPNAPSSSSTTSTTTAATTDAAEITMSIRECSLSSRRRMKFSGIARRPDTVEIDVNSTASAGPRNARIIALSSG